MPCTHWNFSEVVINKELHFDTALVKSTISLNNIQFTAKINAQGPGLQCLFKFKVDLN